MNRASSLQPDNQNKRLYYGYIIEIACFLILAVTVGSFSSFSVFFKPIIAEFGWARAATSGSISLTFVISGLLGILMGHFTDRFGPRLVIIACGILSGTGFLLMSHVSSLWQLYLYYGLFIAFGFSILAPAVSTVTRWFTKNRSLWVGIAVSAGGVGSLVMPLVFTWLISRYGWSDSYIIMGIVVLVINIGAGMLLKPSPASLVESQPSAKQFVPHSEGYQFKEALKTPYFWALVAAYICYAFASGIFQTQYVAHVTDIDFSATTAAGLFSLMNTFNMLGCAVLGPVSDRAGNRKFFIITLFVAAVSVFWLIFIRDLWMLYIFSIFFGLTWGLTNAQQSPLVASVYGVRSLGILLGIISCANSLGGSMGSVLAGYVFDATGSYKLIFVICGILCTTGMLLMWAIKPVRSPRSTSAIYSSK